MSDSSHAVHELPANEWPALLHEINDSPKQLWIRGTLPPHAHKLLCVVGARTYTHYGRDACEHLIGGLRGYPISIVSGLALGIDGIAHRAALACGLHAVAFPGSGLSDAVLYPASHKGLAREILMAGGALLSEYEPSFRATQWSFPKRNRLMAGMCHATLVIEATKKSGTLITARLASEYNRELLVVPGSIFSANSEGPHLFMKIGATPVTTSEDILQALAITPEEAEQTHALTLSPDEQILFDLLTEPLLRDTLIERSGMPAHHVSGILMRLELAGAIRESGGLIRRAI